MAADTPMERAIRWAGSEAKLAQVIGCSQHAVWRAKRGVPPPWMAVRIDLVTGGRISRFKLRPDVFVRHVGAQRKAFAAASVPPDQFVAEG